MRRTAWGAAFHLLENFGDLRKAAELESPFECDDAERQHREHARHVVVARKRAALVDAEALVDALAARLRHLAENAGVEADAAPAGAW